MQTTMQEAEWLAIADPIQKQKLTPSRPVPVEI